MLNFTPRELAIVAAIVLVFSSWFIDQNILYAVAESLRALR